MNSLKTWPGIWPVHPSNPGNAPQPESGGGRVATHVRDLNAKTPAGAVPAGVCSARGRIPSGVLRRTPGRDAGSHGWGPGLSGHLAGLLFVRLAGCLGAGLAVGLVVGLAGRPDGRIELVQ